LIQNEKSSLEPEAPPSFIQHPYKSSPLHKTFSSAPKQVPNKHKKRVGSERAIKVLSRLARVFEFGAPCTYTRLFYICKLISLVLAQHQKHRR